MPRYSVIVPVYNRPQEVAELLESLTRQTFADFEVILVEDGSTDTCEEVVARYAEKLALRYFRKPNSGPGPARNFGYQRALGEYLVVFDSDCVIPPRYFEVVEEFLSKNPLDAWGGPDQGHEDFTPIQRAVAHTMSSFLTTGGIRGGKQRIGSFQPRSFNMGISREVFQKTGGFRFDRFAEDIEFSIRMKNAGFRVALIADAFVFHRRRTNLKQFFTQVANFGKGRVQVGREHPGEVKLAHWFPVFFFLGLAVALMMPLFNLFLAKVLSLTYLLYLLAIGVQTLFVTRSLKVAMLSIPAAVVQLSGYCYGFLNEKLKPGG